jgi:hypothetical protein
LISLSQTSWGNLKLLLTPYSICRHIWFFIIHPLLHRLNYKLLGGNHFTNIVNNNKIILIIKHKHTQQQKQTRKTNCETKNVYSIQILGEAYTFHSSYITYCL